MGLGISFIFVPLAAITVDPIPAEQMESAAGIIALMRNIGGGLGISAVTTLLARRKQFHQERVASNITTFSPLTAPVLTGLNHRLARYDANVSSAGRNTLHLLYDLLLKQAAVLGHWDAFRLLMLLFVGSPLVWLMRKLAHQSEQGADTRN